MLFRSKPISESISTNFKDLPPEGQVQVAQKLGIKLDAAKLAAEDAQDKLQKSAPPLAGGPPAPGAGAAPIQ